MAPKPVKYFMFMVDAFTYSAFKGGAAAVCFLEQERDQKWLQDLAAEFNVPQTCFLTRITGADDSLNRNLTPKFHLRWFTPVAEYLLTLAVEQYLLM